jgi:hypothetical protein
MLAHVCYRIMKEFENDGLVYQDGLLAFETIIEQTMMQR